MMIFTVAAKHYFTLQSKMYTNRGDFLSEPKNSSPVNRALFDSPSTIAYNLLGKKVSVVLTLQ